ncbi:MAG TPA: hypothetical protein DCS87_14850 [Rheinheimera sp.]|nr:hypothetical protein [Rheinheimera sp.]
MKKLAVLALAMSMTVTSSQAAVEAAGDLVAVKIAGAVILVSAATAMIINHRTPEVVKDVVIPDPKCAGTDLLVDGLCYGHGFKTITSGTGTAATVIQVPVTFTYKPV